MINIKRKVIAAKSETFAEHRAIKEDLRELGFFLKS